MPPPYPSFTDALKFWFKLGFISFGGPAGQIAMMHEYLVEKRKWVSEQKFLHALNYCMLLPGPEAQQLATYTGWLLHGIRGGLAAGLLFILPSMFLLWVLSYLYVTFGDMPMVSAIFEFLKPAVVAIILTALIKIGRKSLSSYFHYLIALVAFICIYFLEVPFPLLILGALLTGFIIMRFVPRQYYKEKEQLKLAKEDETSYVINQYTPTTIKGMTWKKALINILLFGLIWVLPLLLLKIISIQDFTFWKHLSLFFTKAAFVTIGGAYAVLPYVAQISVETFGWLTTYEMIDGLALGETTPGPLIMVLAFVGFMAGFNSFGGSITLATLGLTLTTFYTFLPSFFFIFVGAPWIERTQSNIHVKSLLSFATAAVTGVILHLGVYFGLAVMVSSSGAVLWIPLVWMIISFIFLQYVKVNMILWIGISLVIGIIKFILQ